MTDDLQPGDRVRTQLSNEEGRVLMFDDELSRWIVALDMGVVRAYVRDLLTHLPPEPPEPPSVDALVDGWSETEREAFRADNFARVRPLFDAINDRLRARPAPEHDSDCESVTGESGTPGFPLCTCGASSRPAPEPDPEPAGDGNAPLNAAEVIAESMYGPGHDAQGLIAPHLAALRAVVGDLKASVVIIGAADATEELPGGSLAVLGSTPFDIGVGVDSVPAFRLIPAPTTPEGDES